jgi:peptidoglycan/xylan/chitin deacetylase (PgdA/CDA1 family)
MLYATGFTRPSRVNKHHLTIVTFHRVLPQVYLKSYPLTGIAVTIEEFSWFIAFFSTHFLCGSLAESLKRWKSGEDYERPLLALTFDDGQLDNFLYAKPILDNAGLQASFFVVTNHLDQGNLLWHDRLAYATFRLLEQDPAAACTLFNKLNITSVESSPARGAALVVEQAKKQTSEQRLAWIERIEDAVGGVAYPHWDGMMQWTHLQALIKDGHEIGSHSMSHPILPHCSDTQLVEEVESSRRHLQERLATPIDSFCYPNGDYDERTLRAVQQAGYRQAVTTQWGLNTKDCSQITLRRCYIDSQQARSRKGELSMARLAWRLSDFYPGL